MIHPDNAYAAADWPFGMGGLVLLAVIIVFLIYVVWRA